MLIVLLTAAVVVAAFVGCIQWLLDLPYQAEHETAQVWGRGQQTKGARDVPFVVQAPQGWRVTSGRS